MAVPVISLKACVLVSGGFRTTETTQVCIFSYQPQKKKVLNSCFTESAINQIVCHVEFDVHQFHQVTN